MLLFELVDDGDEFVDDDDEGAEGDGNDFERAAVFGDEFKDGQSVDVGAVDEDGGLAEEVAVENVQASDEVFLADDDVVDVNGLKIQHV